MLGAQDPVMHKLVPALVRQMGAAYPELTRAQAMIEETLRSEETRFRQTLDRGLRLLDDELARLPEGADLPGEAAFKLYDTFGFPLDLTRTRCAKGPRGADRRVRRGDGRAETHGPCRMVGFRRGRGATIWFELAEKHGVTEFLGYDTEEAEGQITALVIDGADAAEAGEGAKVAIVVNHRPSMPKAAGRSAIMA